MVQISAPQRVSCSEEISLVSYNLLAQSLLEKNRRLYRHLKDCPEVLEWEYRKENLLNELLESGANVRGRE